MDMVILNSNSDKISFISGKTESVTRADVDSFSFKEDPSLEKELIQEYDSANDEYVEAISTADEIFLTKKAEIENEYNESVRHCMEVFSGELADADAKKAEALELICLEKEKLLKVSSEKLKSAKDRLESYRENVKKLQEIEALRDAFIEEDKKIIEQKAIESSRKLNTGVSAAYTPVKTSGTGKLKF